MTQIIEIVISPTGQTKVETKGFSGPSCREASRSLEDALGNRTAETLTAEFYQSQTAQQITRGSLDMTAHRRRVLRPHHITVPTDLRRQRLVEKRRAQLDRERLLLNRWMSRMKRAFHALEKQQGRVVRLEKSLAQLDES